MPNHKPNTCPGWYPSQSWQGMCYVCWKEKNPNTRRKKTKRKFPSVLEQVATFVKAASKHIRAGRPKPPPEEIERRQSICNGCPENINGKCAKCGCRTRTKVGWLLEKCPLEKW